MIENSFQNESKTRRFSGLSGNSLLVAALLAVIMIAGGYLRFVGQNWDDYTHPHPDERFLTGAVSALGGGLAFTGTDLEGQYARCLERYPQTGGIGGYFDAQCSNMNPHNVNYGLMVYGTLPLFMVRAAGDLTVSLSGDLTWGGYNGIHLVGRTLSALAEMGVILIVFFIGRRLHDKWIGLLAAALYSVTVFSIQQAHFWTADAMSNFFVVLTIWFAVRVQDDDTLPNYLGFGLAFGAALASRVNNAPLLGLLFLAVGLRLLPLYDRHLARSERGRTFLRTVAGLVIAGIATLVVFRLTNPYAFTGPGIFGLSINPRWLDDINTARYLVSGEAESPPNWQWVGRTPYLFAWNNIVLWGMGIFYGLTAWAGWLWSGWRVVRGKRGGLRNLLLFVWILVYFGWLGRNWVATMRYFLSLYPVLALLAAWALVELVRRANHSGVVWRKLVTRTALAGVLGFAILWAFMFTNVYRHLSTNVQASQWILEHISGDFSMQVEGADAGTPLINIAVFNGSLIEGTPLELQSSRFDDGNLFRTTFTAPADGVVTTVHVPHLGDLSDDDAPETLHVTIGGVASDMVFSEGSISANFSRVNHPVGDPYDITLTPPLEVKKGEIYQFNVAVTGGPVVTAGAVFSWEGAWNEATPAKVCKLPDGITLEDDPPPGLVGARECIGEDLWSGLINGYQLQVAWEDTPAKRDRFEQLLDDSDYLIIDSNRRYDSQSRNAARWPMTMRYYDALFSGELGFELIQTIQETFELGPLQVSDQYLPTYSGPQWLNEFEAEEAFHVYDHPVLFIFRKTDQYTSQNTRRILDSVVLNQPDIVNTFNYVSPDMVGVVPLYSLPVNAAPTELQFTPELEKLQYDNGTWSSR
ncbi:MAG: glycosyltransferase family 39 protein, partial [Anaerolineae bacterium]|nr:glycosyltransferase family 39 protein [Anaerolineae bacterium]